MDTNHFFSFSRIAMVMKREIIENWKKEPLCFHRTLCSLCAGRGG